jgi:hypothetical protein
MPKRIYDGDIHELTLAPVYLECHKLSVISQEPQTMPPISLNLNSTRMGDVTTILPAQSSLKDAIAILRDLPKPPETETREPIDLPARD